MLQAEIAGRMVPGEGHPVEGTVLRDFRLPSSGGAEVQLSEYRARANLVVVFAGDKDSAHDLLSQLERGREELAANEAQSLGVVARSQKEASELKRALGLGFEILADEDAKVHRLMGAEDREQHIMPRVFVTDRFGEIFAIFKPPHLPDVSELLSWIEFIGRQCPECAPREWLE